MGSPVNLRQCFQTKGGGEGKNLLTLCLGMSLVNLLFGCFVLSGDIKLDEILIV